MAEPLPPIDAEPSQLVYSIPDLRRILHVGPATARGIAREIGFRIGRRKLGVTRDELARYLSLHASKTEKP